MIKSDHDAGATSDRHHMPCTGSPDALEPDDAAARRSRFHASINHAGTSNFTISIYNAGTMGITWYLLTTTQTIINIVTTTNNQASRPIGAEPVTTSSSLR